MGLSTGRRFAVGILAAVSLFAVGCTVPQGGGTAPPPSKKLVSAAPNHSCSVDQNRQVACWGQNVHGQLGVGSVVDSAAPLLVPGMSDVSAVNTGFTHTCAIRLGAVWCWGGNSNGQLGDGTTTDRPSPVRVPGLSGIVQIGTGVGYTCALDSAGTLSCWGQNSQGQLGNGTTVDSPTPVAVTGIGPVAAMSISGLHACALTTSAEARCWGDNGTGQLGIGTTVDSAVPVAPLGIPTASDLEAGAFHTCARVGASMFCWGNNAYGQLGTGNTTGSLVPVPVPVIVGATSLALGAFHSCAVVSGGAVKCWGYNAKGGLGDGTFVASPTPVPVVGLTGVTIVSAAITHTCAVAGTTVWCWGDNGAGQLGNPAAGAMSAVPVLVLAAVAPPPVVPPDSVTTVSTYTLDCQAFLGTTPVQNHFIAAETSVSHPVSVDPGETFRVIVSGAEVDVPLTQLGFSLQNMVDFAFRVAIPENATVVSASYLPGTNTGTGDPAVTVHDGYVELSVPGPLIPGTSVTLPSIDLELRADGPSSQPIVLTLPGTSHADWNYAFVVNVVNIGKVDNFCFSQPTPTLASIAVD